MVTTKLSSKGRIVLAKAVRDQHGWTPGTEFVVEFTPRIGENLVQPGQPVSSQRPP